jgi:uncharacterized protein (TIGR00162 family)
VPPKQLDKRRIGGPTISNNVKIATLSELTLESPILIQGLPGLGFVGKICVDFLVDQLKPVKFAELYSSYLTLPEGDQGVNVELDGTFTLPRYEFYAYTNHPTLIFLSGEVQPRPWGQYRVAEEILNYVEGFGCKTIVAIGGYGVRASNQKLVYAITSDNSVVGRLNKLNVKLAQSGTVKGALGVILGLGRSRGMKCLGLLGATSGTHPDLQAARNVIQVLTEMYNLPIRFQELDGKIADMKQRVKKFREIQTMAPRTIQGTERGEPTRGYIS